jgi:molybdopterin/thiamine biosynthesis adenylyltransferase
VEYENLFERNFSVFSKEEQDKIRRAKVLIVGCGGVGGVVAIQLARSGINNFILIDPQSYEPTNMNRQINCFIDTLGMNKAEVIEKEIHRINQDAKVIVFPRRLEFKEIEYLLNEVDVVIPASDDRAFSAMVIRSARRLKKPSFMGYPIGMLGWVSVFMPYSPSLEEVLGIPENLKYEELKDAIDGEKNGGGRKYPYAEFFAVTQGEWRINWFKRYMNLEAPLGQICTQVWLIASLTCLEVLKVITNKWKPVIAPKHLRITPAKGKIEIKRFSLEEKYYRRICWYLFNTRFGPSFQRRIEELYKKWLSRREKNESKLNH